MLPRPGDTENPYPTRMKSNLISALKERGTKSSDPEFVRNDLKYLQDNLIENSYPPNLLNK